MQNELEGTWYNQHGSRLSLRVDGHTLTGTFRSATGLGGAGDDVPISGFAARDLVCFVANLSERDCLTSWTGHFSKSRGEPALELQWLMAVGLPGRDASEELWRGTWVGSDTFRRQAPASAHGRPHPFPDWP